MSATRVLTLGDQESHRLIPRIKEVSGIAVKPPIEVVIDAADYMRVRRGHVIIVDGNEIFVSGEVYEPRFGMEDQPKYWVKRGYDLDTGRPVIIKFEFYEEFEARFGSYRIPCFRSPNKESEVLELVKGDSRFAQGRTLLDEEGNNLRVIDFIRGKSLFHRILEMTTPHEEYYHTLLAPILTKLIASLQAIELLHDNDLCHGDIRNDHILVDDQTGDFRWIDFDLTQDVMFDPHRGFAAFDVWSFGNVLQLVAGMGPTTFHDIHAGGEFSSTVIAGLKPTDAGAFHHHRLMNLKMVYPYISERLNAVLVRFSLGTEDYYWTVEELKSDLGEAISDLPRGTSEVSW